ncbi:hypothetical protein [Spirillospora sp. NPDC029432]|uniref:hypothetical protein n=1 Tax=Spirillospora sp. NPDC029432 TaxID=3154599 RepID=UPI003452EA54
MINWHPAAGGSQLTFPRPFDLVDLSFLGIGGLPPEARADFETCLASVLQSIEIHLGMGASGTIVPPAGLVMDAGGTLDVLTEHDLDYAYDAGAALTALGTMAQRIAGRASELRCAALYYRARLPVPNGGAPQEVEIWRTTHWQEPPPQDGAQDAIAIDLEHRAGVALALFVPFTWQDGDRLFLGEPLAGLSRRRYWN